MKFSRQHPLILAATVGNASTVLVRAIQTKTAEDGFLNMIREQEQTCSGCPYPLVNCFINSTIFDMMIPGKILEELK